MDVFGHAAWSYLIWKAWMPGLAIVFGVLPDILVFAPLFVYNLALRRGVDDTSELPRLVYWCRYRLHAYTHSLLLSLVTSAAVLAVFGGQWWILAWPAHVVFDILTHPKQKGTPFLHPVSSLQVNGPFNADELRFVAVNTAALVVAYAIWIF